MERYDSYKDSGVEWIGEIPSTYILIPIKYLLEEVVDNRGRTPELLDEGIPYVEVKHVNINGRYPTENTDRYVSQYTYDNFLRDYLKEGDVLYTTVGTLGRTSIIPKNFNGCIIQNVVGFRTNGKCKSTFFYYVLNSEFGQHLIYDVVRGNIQGSVKVTDFIQQKILLPPLSEQSQIVQFLDEKTSLIDSLIEKTKRKIELLKEERTSLINHIVTKGLNPNVEMKDSGVEWIGEIPRGWGVKRLKNVSDVKPSNVDKHIFPDEIQVRMCNYTDVYYNDFISTTTELKSGSCNQMEFEKFRLEKGDVIITKDSESPDDIGIPCLVKDDFEDVVCGYHLTLIRPQTMDGGFIFRFIQSDKTRRYFEIHSNGITRYGLGKYSIENLFLPLPPLSEQEEIVSYLDEKTSTIDKTIELEGKRMELLKEYRQSLISEVVTGKIKVVNR